MHQYIKTTALAFILYIISWHAISQDTTIKLPDSLRINYYTFTIDNGIFPERHKKDTTLTNFQKYDTTIFKRASQGNIGLASRALEFSIPQEKGFAYGCRVYDALRYTDHNINRYETDVPYTELYYVMGRGREQLFNVLHSQKLGNQIRAGLDFRAIGSPGRYEHQQSNNKSAAFYTSFHTKKQKYRAYLSFIVNSFDMEENGGITNDSLFENDTEVSPELLAVRLEEATSQWKEQSFSLHHQYRIASGIKDTVPVSRFRSIFNAGRLYHNFRYSNQRMTYKDTDPDENYYPALYKDTSEIYEQLHLIDIINEAGWTNAKEDPWEIPFSINVSFKHQLSRVINESGYIESLDKQFSHYSWQAAARFIPIRHLMLEGGWELSSGDYNSGDFRIWAGTRIQIKNRNEKLHQARFSLSVRQRAADYFYTYTYNNAFRWANDLSPETILDFQGHYLYQKLNARLEYYYITDGIYLASDTSVKQSGENISILKASLGYSFRPGNFGIEPYICYQEVSTENYYRLPPLYGSLSLYYKRAFFKKALYAALGIDIFFISSYKPDAYIPQLRSFMQQDIKETDDFFIGDVFIRFQVKRARFFLKYYHFNALFMEHNYYTIPNYPLQDAGFKFGVSWYFHD